MTARREESEPAGRILVVDDHELIRDMLSRRLARRGHSVTSARDGGEALAAIAQEDFDVVLLDVMMPGIDGFEVLDRIRSEHAASELPVIMITAKDQSEDVVRALKTGANDYVTKPIDFPVALARINTQLTVRRSQEALRSAHSRMKRDLEAAAMVQRSLLPTLSPENLHVDFSWRYRPCDELGGDLLNIFRIDDRHLGMYVLDVSGHGVPSALLSVAVTRSLSPIPGEGTVIVEASGKRGAATLVRPAVVASRLNNSYRMSDYGGLMFSLLYGVLDLEERSFGFVSAGHPDPVRVTAAGTVEPLACAGGPPIGAAADAAYGETTVELAPGDRIYLFSDGLFEQGDANGEKLGMQRLHQLMRKYHDIALDAATESLVGEVLRWADTEHLRDDVSVLAVAF